MALETFFEYRSETGTLTALPFIGERNIREFARTSGHSGRIIYYSVNDENQRFVISIQEIDANGDNVQSASNKKLINLKSSHRPRHGVPRKKRHASVQE